MAKLFLPSVRCPRCSHANDSDFRFCQQCGYTRKRVACDPTIPPQIDLDEIDARLQQLLTFDQATSYTRQKNSLQKELQNFLAALPGSPTLTTVTPRDSGVQGHAWEDAGASTYLWFPWTTRCSLLWLPSATLIQNRRFLYWET